MNQCAKCGSTTEAGQAYQFYYGLFLDEPKPASNDQPADPGPQFQRMGSEEVFFCDQCLLRAEVREELFRTLLFALLGLFALIVTGLLVWGIEPGTVAAVGAVIMISVLFAAATARLRHLRATLNGRADQQRQAVSTNVKIQETGDQWAIAHRRESLRITGADLFLTRSQNTLWP